MMARYLTAKFNVQYGLKANIRQSQNEVFATVLLPYEFNYLAAVKLC